MISRRESFKVFASGAAVGLTGAVIVATTSCVADPAPAAEVDPIIEAINAYRAERDAAEAMPFEAKMEAAFDEAYDKRVLPLFFKIDGLAPTTMAGALIALRFLQEESVGGPSALNNSLIDGVTAFLEGRA